MKKVLSGVLALILTGALTMSVFAAEGSITATEVKINDETVDLKLEPLKTNAADEENIGKYLMRMLPNPKRNCLKTLISRSVEQKCCNWK